MSLNKVKDTKKSSLLHSMIQPSARKSEESCDEYLIAMKKVHQQNSQNNTHVEMMTPRERHRNRVSINQAMMKSVTNSRATVQQATRISTIVSMVPDEIIYKHSDYSVRSYETALMFIDISAETFYYFYAMVILLDTGYCVESYGTCEQFYINKGDAILRSKTPEAAWNFFVAMWLFTIRIGAWERSILWEEKIRNIMTTKMGKYEYSIMLLVRLVEGLIITLVSEMDNRNIKKIILLEKALKSMFQDMNEACQHAPMYRPRYLLLFAYYHYIRGKKQRGFSYLTKAIELSKQCSHGTLLFWAEHTRNHWKGALNPKSERYWVEHVEPDNLLDYREFDMEKGKIIPYTLPLPRDLER